MLQMFTEKTEILRTILGHSKMASSSPRYTFCVFLIFLIFCTTPALISRYTVPTMYIYLSKCDLFSCETDDKWGRMASTYLGCPGSHGISKGDGKESTVCYGTFLLWTSTRTVHVRSCLVKGTQQSMWHLEIGTSWMGWWEALPNSKDGDNRQDFCFITSYSFMQRFKSIKHPIHTNSLFSYSHLQFIKFCGINIVREVSMFMDFVGYPYT